MTEFLLTTRGSILTNYSLTVCIYKMEMTAAQKCNNNSGTLIVNQDSSIHWISWDNNVVSAWIAAVNLSQGIDNVDLVH